RAGLGEPENVVDEQQDVCTGFVSEVLGYGQSRQCNTKTGSGRLSHLSIDQSSLGLGNRRHIDVLEIKFASFLDMLVERLSEVNYFRLNHFADQIVAFACPFPYSAENRETTVLQGHVVDQLHD